MSSSNWQSVHQRIFVVTITLAGIFSIIFYVYYKNQLSTYDLSMITKTLTANHAKPQGENDIIVLIWMWPFGGAFDLTCAPFNINDCFLTDNKAMYSQADAVMFHHCDIHSHLAQMPKTRPYFQKWVWWNMESPYHSATHPGLNNLFNLTCSHRRDADIFTPYGNLVPVSKEDELFMRVPFKDKLVCWIVSNFDPSYKRVGYYNELKRYINIEVWGGSFGHKISEEKYIEIMKSCKFYLSFEKSIHKDYITEKFFRPLELGTVPVVLGPPRDDYEIHAPGNSFIHVDDFPSPKELAEKLEYLDKHPDEYKGYFEWRNHFKAVNMRMGQEHACRTCQFLKKHKRYQIVQNLNKWYWEE